MRKEVEWQKMRGKMSIFSYLVAERKHGGMKRNTNFEETIEKKHKLGRQFTLSNFTHLFI